MQVLALLRGNEEEQINKQREIISQYCESNGYVPNFQTISDIAEVDLTSLTEKALIFYDTARISRDFYKFINFLKYAEEQSIKIIIVNIDDALNLEKFNIEKSVFQYLLACFLNFDREKKRQHAKEYAKAYWTSERRAEHSLRMKDIYRMKKAQTP